MRIQCEKNRADRRVESGALGFIDDKKITITKL